MEIKGLESKPKNELNPIEEYQSIATLKKGEILNQYKTKV